MSEWIQRSVQVIYEIMKSILISLTTVWSSTTSKETVCEDWRDYFQSWIFFIQFVCYRASTVSCEHFKLELRRNKKEQKADVHDSLLKCFFFHLILKTLWWSWWARNQVFDFFPFISLLSPFYITFCDLFISQVVCVILGPHKNHEEI